MQRILDLIEETLDAELSPAELAEASGYSHWHFLHLFREQVGMPLCRYRNRRRLAHAIWHMSHGMRVTDAALRWGFGTHSGFYRAFQREYGCTPAEFLRTHRVRRPEIPQLKEEEFLMLTRERFREALTHWGLGALPLTPVTYPGSGAVSETAMYAGDDHVVRFYRDEHTCRLACELSCALDAQGVPAAVHLPLPDGRASLPLCGMQAALTRRLKGEALLTPQLLRAPEESGLRIGRALAGLHRALEKLSDLPYADDLDIAAHLTDWALPRAIADLPENFPADFAARAAALRELPCAIVHRDPNPGNLIDTAAGVGFVDFDLSVRTVRIFDPCYTATAVLSESYGRVQGWEERWPVFARAVLKGYDSLVPLTEAERQAVPTLIAGNELLALAAFAGSSKYREIFETNRAMLGWVLEHMPA
ncbi:MAG: helix-turn-helix domain-containing protein [Clostridia bacterium]|nr:helix-turn-helix domain-containing protein [Clostridia bacterium]